MLINRSDLSLDNVGGLEQHFVHFILSRHLGYNLGAIVFLQFKELNCFVVLICSHIFMIFGSQIEVMILVTPKQEVGRKSEWFCGVKFFSLILEQREKGV